mmetsp:Transcript_19803/g.29606  ORF Transcript_19803/g.29606 Transcript_19803/m.29606 type:complete len:1162 (-) Transcript_19803:232-3717(-)
MLTLRTKFTHTRSCFVSLPDGSFEHLKQSMMEPVPLRLDAFASGARRVTTYVSWAGKGGEKPGHIGIPMQLANCLKISEGILLRIIAFPGQPTTRMVCVEPESSDDWEILELNASYVESELLNQISVLTPGEKFPFWIRNNLVYLKTSAMNASSSSTKFVKIGHNSEISIAPKLRRVASNRSSKRVSSSSSTTSVLRVQPLPDDTKLSKIYREQRGVFVNEATLDALGCKSGMLVALQARNIRMIDPEMKKDISTLSTQSHAQVLTTVLRVFQSEEIADGHAQLPRLLREHLGIPLFSTVVIQRLTKLNATYCKRIRNITLEPVIFQNYETPESFRTKLPSHHLRPSQSASHDRFALTPSSSSRGHTNVAKTLPSDEKVSKAFWQWVAIHEKDIPVIDGSLITLEVDGETIPFSLRINKSQQKTAGSRITGDERKNRLTLPGGLNTSPSLPPLSHMQTSKSVAVMYYKISLDSSHSHTAIPQTTSGHFKRNKSTSQRRFHFVVDHKAWQIRHGMDEVMTGKRLIALSGCPSPAPFGDYYPDLSRFESVGAIRETRQKLTGRLDAILGSKTSAIERQATAGLIIVGGPGTGKSTLLKAIGHHYTFKSKIKSHCSILKCSELVNEKLEAVRSRFAQLFQSALSRAPSMILIDDIDQLIPAAGDQPSPANLRATQLAECFIDIMSGAAQYYASRPVVVIATAKSENSFSPSLQVSGGLCALVTLSPPSPDGRREILERVLDKMGVKLGSKLDLRALAYKTEGYVGLDLEQLAHRIVHAARMRSSFSYSSIIQELEDDDEDELGPGILTDDDNEYEDDENVWFDTSPIEAKDEKEKKIKDFEHEKNILVTKNDLDEALEGFTPVSLQGLALEKGTTTWEDIGGLENVKETLKETLQLPTLYAPLFARVPLKLRSGILLYGPPGCGKTLLASAVAKECGLNFISIKGPELLNKYIGASEQAVRDAFAKAGAAKPCVLFFDEFEAICPARGGDSTGVTDRVVNQMLCHLDGVEGRSEVYVLAASSRPDLIDPALLRPGRLDKSLYCGFPSEGERFGILTAISRKLSLAENVDLKTIAFRTENYSGADLKGLVNDAQLLAVHDTLAENSSSDVAKMPKPRYLNGNHKQAPEAENYDVKMEAKRKTTAAPSTPEKQDQKKTPTKKDKRD